VFSAKTYSLVSAAAAMLILGVSSGSSATKDAIILAQAEATDAGQASPQPSAAEEAAPAPAQEPAAEDGQGSPAAEGTGETAAPAPESEAPADAGTSPAPESPEPATGDDKPASSDGTSSDVAPVAPEAPAAQEPGTSEESSAQSSTIDASHLKIGQAVLGSDGAKIGEVNGVKSDTAGKVQEILVTAGTAAGINAQVYAIAGDKITEVADSVKLSLTSEDAKQLPVIDPSSH
jgi:hypothetical protein